MCSIIISHSLGKKDMFDLTIRGYTITLPYDDMANLINLCRAAIRDDSSEKVFAYYDCKAKPYELA